MENQINCAFCNGVAFLSRERRILTYKGKSHRVVAYYYKCNLCKEEFTTTESDYATLKQVYRKNSQKDTI